MCIQYVTNLKWVTFGAICPDFGGERIRCATGKSSTNDELQSSISPTKWWSKNHLPQLLLFMTHLLMFTTILAQLGSGHVEQRGPNSPAAGAALPGVLAC